MDRPTTTGSDPAPPAQAGGPSARVGGAPAQDGAALARGGAASAQPTLPLMDGRKARSVKTRQAIVDATIALLEGGDLKPTAAVVADKAGLSVRSIFQHFSDLEDLFLAVSDAQANRVAELFANARYEGDLTARLDAFLRYRTTLYETVTPVRRAAMLQEPFSRVVAARLDLARNLHRIDVVRAFQAEIDAARTRGDAMFYEALCAAASFPLWDDLRRYQGLSVEDAARVYRRTLAALLTDAGGR